MAEARLMTEVLIRKVQQADLPELAQFITQFVATGELLPRTLDELEDLIDHFFVAIHEDEIVGCAALEIYNKKLAEIRSLAVSPKVQGMGVGRRLVDSCIKLAREREIFEVMAISASDDFFLACGFDYTLPRLRKAFFLQTRDQL